MSKKPKLKYRSNVTRSGATPSDIIVYGACCFWWDSIDKASHNSVGLPCCPHCKGVLMECPNERRWWDSVDAFANNPASNFPDCRAFIEWCRGKCFRGRKEAESAWRADPRGQ